MPITCYAGHLGKVINNPDFMQNGCSNKIFNLTKEMKEAGEEVGGEKRYQWNYKTC